MKKIPLTQGKCALIDDDDYAEIAQYKWCYSSVGYALRRTRKSELGGGKNLYLHRQLMRPEKGKQVDHINGDTLDNRRSNLRVCTSKENSRNWIKKGPRGITFSKGKWVAQITVDYKNHNLGRFKDKEDAMRAYDVAAKLYFGEFAQLNFKESK